MSISDTAADTEKRTQLFAKNNSEILKMIATGQSASNIYNAIALMYEARHPGLRCSLLELKGDKLIHGGAPSLPKEYCDAVNGLKVGPCVGSCGTSTYTGKRVLVENIETDPKWANIKQAALPHGMRCCWSEPIKDSNGKVLGAFGMYYNHPALPNKDELADLQSAGRLTGIIMERDQREITLRQSEKKYRLLTENASDVVFRINISDGSYDYISPSSLTLFGFSPECFYENSQLLLEILPKEWTAFFSDKWNDLRSGQRPSSYEFPICHKLTTEIRWMLQSNDWITDKKGELIALQGRITDITKRRQVEEALKKNHDTLEQKVKERTSTLEDMNIALTILLQKRDEDKKEVEEKIFSNYKSLISPFLEKLKHSLTKKEQRNLLKIVEVNLKELLEPFSQKLSDPMLSLTPTEIQISGMVKQGFSNKEMAQILNNSVRTITNHRQHIRIKLGLKNKKINLRTYLSTL